MKSRLARNAVRVGLGLAVGLGIAEVAFRVRDGGAFPHVNFYVEDAELGVRLRPGATEKISFSKNPVTNVRINAAGFRGGDWPAPSANEVIVVGDSQVLGLGVDENETFSSVLEASLGAGTVVRNLGVPTYGPPEYNAVVKEALERRPAKTVVYVVNLSNDLFEATRRNRERHAVWDGWAVRKESAPASVTKFPGRSVLFTESHAFFALRGFLYARLERDSEQGFQSEGTWRDIGTAAVSAQGERAAAEAESGRLAQLRQSEIQYAADAANLAAHALDEGVIRESYTADIANPAGKSILRDDASDYADPNHIEKTALYEAGRLSPGDIVTTRSGEEGRDIRVTAEHVRRGAALRLAVEKKIRQRAEEQKNAELLSLFQKRDTAEKNVVALRSAPPPKIIPLSPLSPAIREVKATCDRYGARLVVVALPIDVQVSKAEWAKYHVDPVDMEPTKVLNDDVVVAARVAGADGFDAFDTLSAAEPGAFLDGDLHMTPKGHRALGEALAKVLRAPHLAPPDDGLPASRSWPPTFGEWRPSTEFAVTESDPAGCETKRLREWLGIFCRDGGGAKGVTVTGGIEVMAGALPGVAMLVAPIVPGQAFKATFTAFNGATRELAVKAGGTPEVAFGKALPPRTDIAGPSKDAGAFCTCFAAIRPGATCADARAVPDAQCMRSYPSDCARMVACASGDPSTPPKCEAGEALAGTWRRCRPLCAPELPCKTGTCTTWQGGQVCL